jgi:hypothetical protein
MTEFRTPIPVGVEGKAPALAIGCVEAPGQELAFSVIGKADGQITVEAISRLRGTGVYATDAQEGR